MHRYQNWLAGLTILALALWGRFWRLSNLPAGLHQDEAWFGYNGWLLLRSGSNIYGDKWPLTVDMWGDFVSAVHSYVLVPFIALFGANAFAFRTGIIVTGLIAVGLALWWLYRQTGNWLLIMIAGTLWALSPWSIVMSRASSSVVVDSMMLAALVLVASGIFWQAAKSKLASSVDQRRFWLGLVLVYGLTLLCYITYFTSRLLIPPFLVMIGLYTWWHHRHDWSKQLTAGIALVIAVYLIFPFGMLLNTPYSLGRYHETAILGSDTVQAALNAHIAQAGQAGLPIYLTRFRYNKVTENLTAVWQQYVTLLSPSTLMFQTGPPARYAVPDGGAVTLFEYLGVVLALFYLVLGRTMTKKSDLSALVTTQHNLKPLIALSLGFLLVAAVPSALTQDDFPNLQRAVIMIPWLQLSSALGWFVAIATVFANLPSLKKWQSTLLSPITLTLAIVILSVPSLVIFWFGYAVQAPFDTPFHRSRAGEELAVWINANAQDAKVLHEHVEGVFFYPYLFANQDIRLQPIQKPDKYFLTATDFWVGNRHFVRDLCASPELRQDYDYYIFFTLHERCPKARRMAVIFEAKYDDGSTGFTVYQHTAASRLDFVDDQVE